MYKDWLDAFRSSNVNYIYSSVGLASSMSIISNYICSSHLRNPMNRPTTQPPTPACSGTKYTISSTDTCVGISMNKGISTDDLLSYNLLPSLCNYFPKAGTSLCIPDSQVCQPYTVQKDDTCSSLQSQFKISYAQLIAWNPSIGPKCSNIEQYIGYAICVSNPGGNYVNPSPTTITSTPV